MAQACFPLTRHQDSPLARSRARPSRLFFHFFPGLSRAGRKPGWKLKFWCLGEALKKLKRVYKNKKYELHSPKIIGNEKKYLNDCLKNKNISSFGSYKIRLEKKIKDLTKAKYVILTSSGTAAIHLTLEALKVNKKHEIFW